MPKFKIIEYRTTPHIFEVEAKTEDEAQELFEAGECVELGRDDDIDVSNEVEQIGDDEVIEVEYPVERT